MQIEVHHVQTEIPTLGHRRDVQIVMEHEVAVGGLWEVERNL
jgi:hypothetical protein